MNQKRPSIVKRILMIRLSALGDCVVAYSGIPGLAESFPHAHIAWAIQDNFAPLIRNLPGLDEIVIFPRRRWKQSGFATQWKEGLRLFRHLRMRKFDVTIDVQSNTKSAMLAFLTGARLRIGHGMEEAKRI
jgi:ADP-heptose:LPS heptosyltransferase